MTCWLFLDLIDPSFPANKESIRLSLSLWSVLPACLPVYGRSVSVAVQQKWERVFIGKVKPLLCFNQPLYLYQPLHSTPLLYTTRVTEFIALHSFLHAPRALFCSFLPSFPPFPSHQPIKKCIRCVQRELLLMLNGVVIRIRTINTYYYYY